MELPEGEIFVSTNELYLSLVIENLLDNANEFTDSGSITLKMRLDKMCIRDSSTTHNIFYIAEAIFQHIQYIDLLYL